MASSIITEFLSRTSAIHGIDVDKLYCTQNGKKIVSDDEIVEGAILRWGVRLIGGKGGFGSMLRAIGAQIEKTTNREACRDLSGRRLRDIREERRLLDWAASQPQREEEARQRKEQKLKRMCATPKYEFKDEAYEKSRSQLEESVDAAVEQGTKAGPSTSGVKNCLKRKKPAKLWIDDDLSGLSSDESDEETQNSNSVESSVSESDGSKNEDEEPLNKLPRIAESSNGIPVAPS